MNALYLQCCGLEMLTGFCIDYECTVTDWFRPSLPSNQSIGALEWLAHVAISRDMYIQHAGNSNEKALGMKKLRVYGWCEETKTALEYDGCYYHGHTCITNRANLPAVAELAERAENTKAQNSYIRDVLGITLEVMQECTWNQKHKKN